MDASLLNVGGNDYNVKDAIARADIYELRVLDKSPFLDMWNKLDIEKTSATSAPGLMTTSLTVWGAQYPQYFGHYDVTVSPGQVYAIEGTWFASGYKPFMLANGNTLVYTPQNNPSSDTLYRNIIKIPDGVNRLIVNFGLQNGTASSTGVVGTVTGMKYASQFCDLDAINPDTYSWGDYIIEEEASNPGLITNALIVVQTQYPQYYKYYDISVTPGEIYAIEGQAYSSGYLPVMLAKDDTMLYYPESYYHPATNTRYRNIITIPDGVNRLLVNGDVVAGIGVCGKIVGNRASAEGKKIVWFGTSIPAGNANPGGGQTISSYPVQIGKALGATVYNEAVGSSCARGGNHNNVTAEDPLGWGGMDVLQLMLSLSLSSTEKQGILDNWDSKWKNIISDTTTIDRSSAAVTNYKNCSWDIKLAKYLSGGSVGQVDMYVFDHGYNDAIPTYGFTELAETPATPTDRSYFFGAMAFLFKKILDDNPKAQIVVIGHYNHGSDPFGRGANYAGSYVCEAQSTLATNWGFDMVKTWEKMGISMNTITVDGSEITVLQSWFPDKLHPSSDTTGKALEHYANVLTPIIRNIGW
jgi:hypothetical protein